MVTKTGKKDNRGGYRPNAGRKKETLSVLQIREMRAAAEKKAEETGQTLFDVCLGWIYDLELSMTHRQTAMKIYLDKMLVSISEGGEADKEAGPSVFLPEHRPHLEVVGGKEK